MAQDRIGFIGLGVMGGAMAKHLAAAGLDLTIFDLNAAAMDRVADGHDNVRKAGSVAELAAQSDVVITMLPSGKEVLSTAIDTDGLRDSLAPGAMLLDTSSAAPWHTKETAAALSAKGIAMVDAPVSGAEVGARAAELVFMVGGSDEDVARARPLLELMGKAIFHLGPLGSGDVMKAMNNLITAVTLTATSEAMLVGTRAGLDPAIMNDVLDISTGESWVSRTHYRARVFNRAFDDTFTFDLMLKDMNIAGRIADDLDMPMQVSNEARSLWTDLQADLPKNSAISRLSYAMEQRTGVELVSKSQPAQSATSQAGRGMFSHAYFGSDDLAVSKRFYDAAMGALGYRGVELPHAIIYPSETGALLIGKPLDGGMASHGNGHTLGFVAKDYAAVDRFHADGIAAGGTSEGEPGFRPTSPGNQYGAYLRDPYGNKICSFAPNIG